MFVINYLKSYGGLTTTTVIFYFVAIIFWHDYLTKGFVYDGKHGMAFAGENAYGHLVFATIMPIFLTYFVIKSIIKFRKTS